CSDDCKSLVDDRCKKCEEEKCHKYMEEVFGDEGDPVAACYTEGVMLPRLDKKTDATFVAECTALTACIRRNRCDLLAVWTAEQPTHDVNKDIWHEDGYQTYGSYFGCLCDEAAPGSGTFDFDMSRCRTAPAGRCVQQLFDASDCTAGGCVEATALVPNSVSFFAHYVAMCQRDRCFKECR
ncbi:MAG TPA: hypothetical protein VMF89_24630, partial [Polyangiales bacterium]|nr:hypothetical protein [Polyangiales bacterium]